MRITDMEFQKMYKVHILEDNDAVGSFDCEDEDLNDFISHEAIGYQRALIAVTYVVARKDNEKIVAYFSLANDKVSLTDFNSNSISKQGMGSYLLKCVKTLFMLQIRTGCRFVTVDAYKSAVPFYEKNGFLPLTARQEDIHTELLYYDLCSNYQ